ncbi:MAG: hypothetical protein JXA67_06375, partial [Micromonosporaceae bacterium]|nr:hypothetical protein [Micromonosporaceae bacterium]
AAPQYPSQPATPSDQAGTYGQQEQPASGPYAKYMGPTAMNPNAAPSSAPPASEPGSGYSGPTSGGPTSAPPSSQQPDEQDQRTQLLPPGAQPGETQYPWVPPQQQ